MSSLREESLELHRKLKGKISQENKVAVETYDDLRLLYSPGVAEPCLEIQKDPSKAYDYTRKGNTIGVFSDGSSVLGLGNIWPLASLPVMEGKAMLIKEFGGINAIPLIIDSQDIETVISTIKLLAPWFGGIHLEDIAAPACFEIEDRLAAELDIPVFHDDQHGTAIIVLAGLINSLKLVGKNKEDVKVVLNGAGSAGFRIAELLRAYGFRNIITFDSQGAIHTGRGELNKQKLLLASYNVENFSGNSLSEGIGGRDVFIGVSRPNMLQTEDIKLMNADSIVFALANPTPEIGYEEAKMGGAAIVATGRSDFPNQINNLSVFPGLRKGLLEKRISKVTIEHKLKLSQILVVYMGEEIDSEHIIPSVFDRSVAQVIADGL